ncbi:hypothetical protein [Listeria aquatica]|uniref:Uncharacterized protein n=1 Tax=Listeria aquatica FSL S10-1188 TaxID=1265818 RepID=W7B0J8_9LIST|nr:hypothetical protein [Listeria aquatica]EUJ18965.1 hypothetical protein MAQA_07703 [Listeria aquatica FSL S10-1188]
MSEIKSSQTEAKQLAEKLRTACDELQQTRQLLAVGTFSTVTPAKEMQSAFSNSLRYTDEYTKNLQDSIEKNPYNSRMLFRTRQSSSFRNPATEIRVIP